ncbi:MAG: alkyl sulfatase C-terminal domain-containing protein, partial [Actinomycetota bacterium]|nr:alkyl sulfatase C-terminal domain-containing protein [Actinomycetota bacterium]
VAGMDLQQAFDLLAAAMDGVAAADLGSLAVDWHVGSDVVRLELSNGTMHSTPGRAHPQPDVVVRGERTALDRMTAEGAAVADLLAEGNLTATGDVDRLTALFACVTEFPRFYNIVEP